MRGQGHSSGENLTFESGSNRGQQRPDPQGIKRLILSTGVWMANIPPFGKRRIRGFLAMTFKTVLVAVDGSMHMAKTAAFAADVAQRYGAKLVVLHVVAPIFGGGVREELANFARI
jgi:universal stress protein family protein